MQVKACVQNSWRREVSRRPWEESMLAPSASHCMEGRITSHKQVFAQSGNGEHSNAELISTAIDSMRVTFYVMPISRPTFRSCPVRFGSCHVCGGPSGTFHEQPPHIGRDESARFTFTSATPLPQALPSRRIQDTSRNGEGDLVRAPTARLCELQHNRSFSGLQAD